MHLRTATHRSALLIAGTLVTALALTACGSSSDPLSSSSSAAASSGAAASGSGSASGDTIVIGSGNFPESALIANIYAEALKAKGVEVSTNLNIGERAVYIKALQDGSIDLVPEYTGVLLQYFDPAATAVTPDDVYSALESKTPAGLKVLDKSAAEDKDAVVVTKETADTNNLKSIADLKAVQSQFVIGGPPEWQTRPTGLPGLESKYGLPANGWKEFKPLDVGGPLTVAALKGDQIQAGDLFTTDPAIADNNFVALEDPNNLFAAQNSLPLITAAKASQAVQDALNAVSAKLDTATLLALNARVQTDKEDSVQVAQDWVSQNIPS